MTSSRLESPARTTGAHRAHPAADQGPRTLGRRPPARYEAALDGLFTYCLSVLCDHDTATAVLGDVLAVAERHHGRCPSDEDGRTAWLYALARWACLRSLGEQRRRRQGAHTGRPAVTAPEPPRVPEETAERRRAELARLAWPEAAGTTPEQREALELAVRHGLSHRQVAAVLSLDPLAARELLATAGCEVERTRAALAVVETGSCPTVARLTGDHQVLLSAALRAELVRHVDDCPRCRKAAERVGATAPWPGAGALPSAGLPLVEAPRAAAYMAMLHVPRARAGAPRFAPTGFPMDPKDHVARRDRMRARAVTTTVVAAVVAAPVLALWTSYRGTPAADASGHDGARISASDRDEQVGPDGRPYDRYENAGNARTTPEPRFTRGSRAPDVSVEVLSPGGPTGSAGPSRPGEPAPGWITVGARSHGDLTLLTLTADGGAPVDWSLWTDAPWLYVSRASGTLRPGETVTIAVRVDHGREPRGAWSARLGVNPSGAVVRIDGRGETAPPPVVDPGTPPTTTRPTTPSTSPPTTGPTTPPTTDPGTTEPTDPSTSPPTTEPTTTPPTTEPTSTPPTTDPGTTEPTTPPPTTEEPPSPSS
ncbi:MULTISPECIES: sigma-70 family RNA polymerase sigma factor [unclassified Streptomyces]|uniref:BACON domain-containing protein n=1 Tax=unclassified Streptomyces TaxID=2593676 RepID=UPI0006F22755|nr:MULTISPECIES: sigma-70 family RNA polymerase sigma factor [unclassified Streptomyces]KQX45674.1 hypothetical protein ASD33_24935 [Streptomyces sp. Root1304]KRA79619.1 hypothetical protein ASE09_20455 [Streptomyces sp. Root66D1]